MKKEELKTIDGMSVIERERFIELRCEEDKYIIRTDWEDDGGSQYIVSPYLEEYPNYSIVDKAEWDKKIEELRKEKESEVEDEVRQ